MADLTPAEVRSLVADILTELHNSGELKEMLDKAFTAQA